MTTPIQFPGEERSNAARQVVADREPLSLRTFTPTQAVFAKSAGVFHWTPEGRRLYDYSSGVLVANLGHNPTRWMQRFAGYMGWNPEQFNANAAAGPDVYFPAVALTAYNGITEIETRAVERLLRNVRRSPGSSRMETVMWAASGSEAIQKALWACLARDRTRDMILAPRFGFHGKKGLANAITGSESDAERDPRVKFFRFPMQEIADHSADPHGVNLDDYRRELDDLWRQYGRRFTCLVTEPYLGGGGSFHPPAAYLRMLQDFCREHDLLFVLDEVQSNFGRTGAMYAFETYGLEPDYVVLGKGLGNGVPVAAVVGRRDVLQRLTYGETSDTWSANPLSCAAVLATLDEFESRDVLDHAKKLTPLFFAGLDRLKQTGLIKHVRGEGMVFGLECQPVGHKPANEVAAEIVRACYLGGNPLAPDDGIHFLGALAGKVLRVSPPLTITESEARDSLNLCHAILSRLATDLAHPAD